jgi:hypothetical protein
MTDSYAVWWECPERGIESNDPVFWDGRNTAEKVAEFLAEDLEGQLPRTLLVYIVHCSPGSVVRKFEVKQLPKQEDPPPEVKEVLP